MKGLLRNGKIVTMKEDKGFLKWVKLGCHVFARNFVPNKYVTSSHLSNFCQSC